MVASLTLVANKTYSNFGQVHPYDGFPETHHQGLKWVLLGNKTSSVFF
jgi:hypothetical protein